MQINENLLTTGLVLLPVKTQVIMTNQTVIYQVNRDDLKELITQAVKDAVKDLQGNEAKPVEGKDADLMSRQEVCKYLDVTAATLHNWNKRGYLESIHIGRLVRYRRADVEALARSNKQ